MFFWGIFFLLFERLRLIDNQIKESLGEDFVGIVNNASLLYSLKMLKNDLDKLIDERKSVSTNKNDELFFKERFKEVREEFKEALEELGENLRPEEGRSQRSTQFTPEINEQLRKLISTNNDFLARMNQLTEKFEFSKEDDYREDIDALSEELGQAHPLLADHLIQETIGRLTQLFIAYENDFEFEKVLKELKKAENLAKKEIELIQKIALNQIEFERTRPEEEKIEEDELSEYRKRLERSTTNETIGIRKEIILEIHKKRQEKNTNKTVKQVKSQLIQEQQAHQQTKNKLSAIPNDWQQQIKSAQKEKVKAVKERDNYQQQLSSQEQKIVQQLNNSLKLGLDAKERDLNKAIVEIQKLIQKDPPTGPVNNQDLQKQLQIAQKTIAQLQNQLNQKPGTLFKESIKEIIKIDEKLLNENQELKIELEKQVSNYEQFAQARNKSVMKQIKNVNIEKIHQLLPRVKKEEVQQTIEKAISYADLAERRNQIINKHIQQNSADLQEIQQKRQKERVILISLLVVSLVSVGGLLTRLLWKNNNKTIS